jgi:hypothetical protein
VVVATGADWKLPGDQAAALTLSFDILNTNTGLTNIKFYLINVFIFKYLFFY